MYKSKKTGIIGIIITIVILIALVILTNLNINTILPDKSPLNKVIVFFQNGITHLKNKIAGNDSFFETVDSLKKQNEELKKENEELAKQLEELEIIKSENLVLRNYSDLSDEYSSYKTVPAYIIGKDMSNLSEVMTINVGTKDGVYENMAVVSKQGVVGYTISVTENSAKVQPLIDIATSISATISTSQDAVVVKGMLNSSNKLKMTFIETGTQLVLDDEVKTSGIGGIYPKGLSIGKIVEIVEGKNIIDGYAVVETSVDFSKLDTVLVITESF